MNDKQKEEMYYAEPILKQLGIQDHIICSDKPDLRYVRNNHTVGIEVTLCFPDEDEKSGNYNSLDSRTRKVCKAFSKKLKQSGVKGLLGTVSFTNAAYEFDNNVSTGQFTKHVFKEIPLKMEQYEYREKLFDRKAWDAYVEKMAAGYYDCVYVDSVDYDLIKESNIVELMPIRTGYYSTLDDKFVRSCIMRKEERLLQYKTMPENREISEYWLFIRVATNSFSDLEDFQVGKYSSCYGRIYITDGGRVLQLK